MVAALIPLLLVLAATFVIAGIVAGSNEYQIRKDYNVSHLWESRERLAALVGFAVLAYWHQWQRPYLMVLAFASACCLFGLRFDIRLNLRRGKDTYYVGTDPQTAATDKTVNRWKLSGKAYAWLKLAGVLAFGLGAVMLSSCAGTKPADNKKNAWMHLDKTASGDSTAAFSGNAKKKCIVASSAPADLTSVQIAQLPRSVQRQYRKNLKAQPRTVPLIQGRASVSAAGSITAPVQTSYKPDAAVVQATDSAKVQVAQSKHGPAVAGNGNQVPIITQKESWLRPLLPYAAGAAGLVLLYSLLPLGLAGSGWLWVLLRSTRSREPETG